MEYLIVTLLLIASAFIYIKLATKFSIIDNPNFRSSHSVPVIRGGGILFYIAVVLFFVFNDFEYPYFFIAITSVSLISFLDDIYTLSAKIRLPFHFVSIALVLYEVGFFEEPYLLILLTLIIGVGFINIYNFMDGINGITGIYSIVVVFSFLLLSYLEGVVDATLLIYVLLSLGIFGYFNFRKKARMFAGDIGSMAIAITIFFIGLYFIMKLQSPVLILMAAVYCADSGLTILYRLVIGESIGEPHRHHIYQKLVDVYKWSHLKVSLLYALYQILISTIVIVSYKLSLMIQILIIIGVVVFLLLNYFILFKRIDSHK